MWVNVNSGEVIMEMDVAYVPENVPAVPVKGEWREREGGRRGVDWSRPLVPSLQLVNDYLTCQKKFNCEVGFMRHTHSPVNQESSLLLERFVHSMLAPLSSFILLVLVLE